MDAKTRMVIQQLEASLRPNEVGTDFRRTYEVEGDCVTLTTTPFDFEGEKWINRLKWKRVK